MEFKVERITDRAVDGESFVEIQSIDQLIKYIEENGPVAIWRENDGEIYDDYRIIEYLTILSYKEENS